MITSSGVGRTSSSSSDDPNHEVVVGSTKGFISSSFTHYFNIFSQQCRWFIYDILWEEFGLIGVAAYLGTTCRFLLTGYMQRLRRQSIPELTDTSIEHTLFIHQSFLAPNLLGCFLIAWISTTSSHYRQWKLQTAKMSKSGGSITSNSTPASTEGVGVRHTAIRPTLMMNATTLYLNRHRPSINISSSPANRLAQRSSLDLFQQSLTTGFCGCLTTFSTWFVTYDHGQLGIHWFELHLLVLLIEIMLVWAAYQIGIAIADIVWNGVQYWDLLPNPVKSASNDVSNVTVLETVKETGNSESDKKHEISRVSAIDSKVGESKDNNDVRGYDSSSSDKEGEGDEEGKKVEDVETGGGGSKSVADVKIGTLETPPTAKDEDSDKHRSGRGDIELGSRVAVVERRKRATGSHPPPPIPMTHRLSSQSASQSAGKGYNCSNIVSFSTFRQKINIFFYSSYLILIIIVIIYSSINNDSDSDSDTDSSLDRQSVIIKTYDPLHHHITLWHSICSLLLTPLGCLIRFMLRRSEVVKPWMNTLPLCTLCANMMGVLIASLLVVYQPNHPWTLPLTIGFTGSLSTVSTWIADWYHLHSVNGAWGSYMAVR